MVAEITLLLLLVITNLIEPWGWQALPISPKLWILLSLADSIDIQALVIRCHLSGIGMSPFSLELRGAEGIELVRDRGIL